MACTFNKRGYEILTKSIRALLPIVVVTTKLLAPSWIVWRKLLVSRVALEVRVLKGAAESCPKRSPFNCTSAVVFEVEEAAAKETSTGTSPPPSAKSATLTLNLF